VFLATYPPGVTTYEKDPKLTTIAKKFPYRGFLAGMDMVYYCDQPLKPVDSKN